ncbi:MAG: hypothetical protein ACLSAH_09980 [Bilophila wadsworthia]
MKLLPAMPDQRQCIDGKDIAIYRKQMRKLRVPRFHAVSGPHDH